MWRDEAVVVIPVYKETLTPNERLSFEQCLRVLGHHPMTLVCPEGLRLDAYEPEKNHLAVRRFSAGYFQSTATYNGLMLSPRFYGAFLRYRYILIYQLDAFVFSDQLSAWCKEGYDYIGAPWIGTDWMPILPMWRPPWSRYNLVGNGGFSLRNTLSATVMATAFRRGVKRWKLNEDGFWAFFAPSYNPLFRIPDARTALRFSFETNPRLCYERTGGRLPFGCHAWEKHDPEFWRVHIPGAGALTTGA
ncbi:MAG: hypothetical protein HY903_18280 [Deltaproteobacteria bacterium]|nr:hypothetical protein [Deltaproteobacteria bacterium]